MVIIEAFFNKHSSESSSNLERYKTIK